MNYSYLIKDCGIIFHKTILLFNFKNMQCQKCGAELSEELKCCDDGICCKMCCKCESETADPECGCDD